MGHTVIMGRRTWESIGRSLPGRRMIVISRQPDYRIDCAGVETAASLEDALQQAIVHGDDEAFIIGGAELYKLALPMADRLYVTVVRSYIEGDTYFPIRSLDEFDWNEWVILKQEPHEADSKNEYPYVFTTLQRCELKATSKPV